MREVIQRILDTEAEAKKILEAAKAGAGQILSDAQQQAQALAERTRHEARLAAEQLLSTAAEAAEREKQERLARAAAEIESQVRLDADTRQRAVEGAVQCVCGRG